MTSPKYEIGNTLCHVGDESVRLFVVEVLTQRCPGGEQVHYRCRQLSRHMVADKCAEFNEIELKPIKSDEESSKDGWKSVATWLSEQKGIAVSQQNFPVAAGLRDIADKLLEIAKM